MRIAVIVPSRLPSTTANSIQVMKVVQAFVRLGHEVHLFASEPVGEGIATGSPQEMAAALADFYALQQLGGKTFNVAWLRGSRRLHRYDFAWRAVRKAQRWRANLVYTWMPQVGLAALLNQMPMIMEVHEPPSGRFGPLLFRLLLQIPGRKRFVPVTQTLANLIERSYPGFSIKNKALSLVVGPDAVDLEPYQSQPDPAEARLQLGLPERFTACYTGHMYPGRGIGMVLELARRFPQASFVLVGGRPDDRAAWEKRAAEAGLANAIFTGFKNPQWIPLYQAASDVLLMPYEWSVSGSSGGNTAEYCSPMKMFEYMASGKAIISSALPAIGEVLNTANSILCPPEEPEAWAAAFGRLFEDAVERQRLGGQALQDVQSYTWLERSARILANFPD